jgi:hypothetical protein
MGCIDRHHYRYSQIRIRCLVVCTSSTKYEIHLVSEMMLLARYGIPNIELRSFIHFVQRTQETVYRISTPYGDRNTDLIIIYNFYITHFSV